jgi:RecJ-like exonuclease
MKQVIPQDLLNRLSAACDLVSKEEGFIRIVSHYDADGICAAGVLCHALTRKDKKFHIKLTSNLKDEYIEFLKKDRYPLTIFCDMGSGQLKNLKNLEGNVIILDHHTPIEDSEDPLQINAHFFGINGTSEICASSLAFMFTVVMDENNWDLSALALAGCIGDKQHINGLAGYNAYMVGEAQERGVVKVTDTLNLNGKSVMRALVEGLDPFICGMSGREDRVADFLKNLNIDTETKIQELHDDQTRLLASAVIVRLLAQGVRPERAEGFISKRFWLPQWNLYAGDLSNYVNACGRMDQTGTGLALCLGEEKALSEAIALRKAYKDELRAGLLSLESQGAHEMGNIQFFYTENPSLAGANAGLGMMYVLNQDKPTFTLSVTEKETKVSSRGTNYLISKGLDLAYACRIAAEKVGGRGGGHPIASGASIPLGKEEAFLALLDDIVGQQIESS